MNIKLYTTTALAILVLGIAGCDDTVETTTTESAVVNGTEIETTTTKEITTESDGYTHTEVEIERTVDPEGLMNKETTTREYESETEYSD